MKKQNVWKLSNWIVICIFFYILLCFDQFHKRSKVSLFESPKTTIWESWARTLKSYFSSNYYLYIKQEFAFLYDLFIMGQKIDSRIFWRIFLFLFGGFLWTELSADERSARNQLIVLPPPCPYPILILLISPHPFHIIFGGLTLDWTNFCHSSFRVCCLSFWH